MSRFVADRFQEPPDLEDSPAHGECEGCNGIYDVEMLINDVCPWCMPVVDDIERKKL